MIFDKTKMTFEKVKDGKLKGLEKLTAEEINSYSSIQHESPIDIRFDILRRISLPPLEWKNEYEPPRLMKLTNTGDSVILSAKWFGPRPFICKGPLLGHYVFSQMHFHWGPTELGGSEHTFDNVRMPLEIHVMFFKSEYLCQENAMKQNDGILSLAFLTELQEEESVIFKPIVDNLYRIGTAGSSRHIDLLPLTYFFQPFTDDYFMYWGSVVSINNILWIISRKPLPISHFQLKLFRYIRNSNQEMIKYNFRPIKPLEGRMVFHVNPSPDNLDSLIISLNEVFNENVSEKRKSKEKRSDEVKNNQKVFLGYDLRTNDNKEESLSEDLQATDNEKPGIDASDIEDPHSLTNILNNVESNSEIEEKSLVVERNETPKENDSFLAMPDIKELKQANDDDYQHYLTKVEEYLRTAIEKVESKRLKAAKENEITPKKLSQTSVTNSSDSVRYHSETLSVPKKLVATNKKEMVDQSVVVDLLKDDNEEIDLTIKSTTDSKTSIKSETESREVVTATNTSYTKSVTSEKKGSERLTSEATDFYLKNKNDSKISDNESNEACFTAITTSYTTKSESEKKSSDHGRISSYIKSATLSEKEYIEKSPKGSLTSVPEYKSRENTPRQVLSSKRPKSAIKYTSAKTSEYSLAKRSKSKGSIKKKVNFSETVECNYYVLTAPSHNSLERRACSDHDINSTLMRRFSSEKSIDPSRNVPSKPNSRETVFNEIIEKSKTTTGKLLKQRKPQLRTTIVTQVFKDSRPTSSQTNSETRTSQSSRTSHSSRIIQNKSSVKSNITKRPAWKY